MATIADAARVGAGDKLDIQGVFDTIFVEAFPAVRARMALVVRLQFEAADETRERRIRVRLVDVRGRRLFEQTALMQIGYIPPGGTPGANVIYQLANTTFRGPGRYRFEIRAGRSRVTLPLRVVGRDV